MRAAASAAARAAAAAVAAAAALAACAPRLDGAGLVRYAAQIEDPALALASASIPGSELVQDLAPEAWSARLAAEEAGPAAHGLYSADWGAEIAAADSAGRLAALGELWPRSALSRSLPRWARSIAPGPGRGFVPASVSVWGLFYNRARLSALGLPAPRDLGELETLLAAAKRDGLVPVALGASFGWPASAWLQYFDLRLNGGEAALERALGTRPFDDAGGVAAASRMADWRDAGFFSPDAASAGAAASARAVEDGAALFVLMGAFGESLFEDPAGLGFAAVPPARGAKGRRGEIAAVGGFAVPASAPDPEAALALAEAYVLARSLGPAAAPGTLPALAPAAAGEGPAAEGSRALSKSDWVVPQLERMAPPGFAQESLRVWAAFFAPLSSMKGTELAGELRRIREAVAEGGRG